MMKFLLKLALFLVAIYVAVGAVSFLTHESKTQDIQWSIPLPRIIDVPAWKRKVGLPDTQFKIGIITDTHIDSKRTLDDQGNEIDRFIPDIYVNMLEAYVQNMTQFDPEFLVHLGDVIEGSGVKQEIGEKEVQMVRDATAVPGKRTYWAIGNHDLRSVTRRKFREMVDAEYTDYYFDEGPYRFVIIDNNYRADGVPNTPLSGDFVPGHMPAATMAWLRGVFDTNQHVYVFMHHTLVPEAFTDKRPVRNFEQAHALFDEYDVTAVFSGHVEKRYYGEIDGIKYFTLPGIKKSPAYPGAFFQLTLTGGVPDLVLYHQNGEGGELVSKPFVQEGQMITDLLPEILKQKAEQKRKKVQEEAQEVNEINDDDVK